MSTPKCLARSHEQFGIDVVSPTHPDAKWQAATEGGIDASQFLLDWDRKQAICPQGHTSVSWTPAVDEGRREVIKIRFSTKDCQACPLLSRCTSSKSRAPRRLLTVQPQARYEALQAARRRQATRAFSQQYALRSGIEATFSQGVRALGLRRSRYSGLSENASATYRYSRCYESGPCRCLVRRRGPRSHTGICFSTALHCCVGGFPNSVKSGTEPQKCPNGVLPQPLGHCCVCGLRGWWPPTIVLCDTRCKGTIARLLVCGIGLGKPEPKAHITQFLAVVQQVVHQYAAIVR